MNEELSVALQSLLYLPMRRRCEIFATDAGNVRLEVSDQRTGEQIAWMEMDLREADMLAAYLTVTVTQIIGRQERAPNAG